MEQETEEEEERKRETKRDGERERNRESGEREFSGGRRETTGQPRHGKEDAIERDASGT